MSERSVFEQQRLVPGSPQPLEGTKRRLTVEDVAAASPSRPGVPSVPINRDADERLRAYRRRQVMRALSRS